MRYRTKLVVDLKLLGENYTQLRKLAPANQILFMVKANSYGHGMIPIVRSAVEQLEIKEFGLATTGEALYLRQELPSLQFEAYVFSDVQIELQTCTDIYLHQRIIPVISSLSDLRFFLSHLQFRHFPLCLKFNTGMNRLGIVLNDLELVTDLLKKYQRREIYHLMSHLACSSRPLVPDDRNDQQYAAFTKIKQYLQDCGITVVKSSISNSGAIEQQFGLKTETHIRPGLMLYGPSSLGLAGSWQGKNISRLETHVISFFPVKQGDAVGYGGASVPEDGRIALIALGYGDGLSTRYRGVKIACGPAQGEFFGRVNMDMAQIFFPGDQLPNLKEGDIFTVWSHDIQDIMRLSFQMETIPYELVCQLTGRIPREYCY